MGDSYEEDDDEFWNQNSRKNKSNFFNDDKEIKSTAPITGKANNEKPTMFKSKNDDSKTSKSTFYLNDAPLSTSSSPKLIPSQNRTSSISSDSSTSIATRVSALSVSRERADSLKELKLKAEISNKEAELLYFKAKKEEAPDIPETIERILLDKPYWFDLYKTKAQKINLLEAAIKSYDGNAILAVVLFIKRTLTKSLFLNIIISKPEALNHYIYYLEQMKDFQELSDIYRQQGKHLDAAATEYRQLLHIPESDTNEKMKILNSIRENYKNDVSNFVDRQIKLLEFQKKLEKSTSSSSSIYDALLSRKNDSVKLETSDTKTVYDTMNYFLKNYQKISKNDPSFQLENIKTYFGLTNKQFAYLFIKNMAECGYWTEIERFTTQQSQFSNLGLGSLKRSADISWESIASIIHTAQGPDDEVKKYLRLVEDVELRQNIAIKYKIHDVLIETCKQLKDRTTLMVYRNKLQPNSPEYNDVDKAMKDTSIKWKT